MQHCDFPARYLLQFSKLKVYVCEEDEDDQVLTTFGRYEKLVL